MSDGVIAVIVIIILSIFYLSGEILAELRSIRKILEKALKESETK